MKVEKRKEIILDMLNKNGTVRVTSLSKALGISEVSVRSYLSELEKMGLLTRVHGGAICSYKPYYSMNVNQRMETNRKQKERIASITASLIKPNDTVMFNAGTTTLLTFRYLPHDYNLNIITNSVSIALEGSNNPNFNIVLTGGTINSKYQFCYGENALSVLRNYHANKLILSVDGIDFNDGFSTYYDEETMIDRLMIERSECCIIAADATKFNKNAFSKVSELEVADYLVTDYSFSEKEKVLLNKMNIKTVYY